MDKEILRYGKILTNNEVTNGKDCFRFINIKYDDDIYYLVKVNGATVQLCNLTKKIILINNYIKGIDYNIFM